MASHKHSRTGSHATQAAARAFTRRNLLQWSAAGATALAAGPFISRQALSSSGSLTWFTWSDYSTPELVSAFESATGI